MVRQSALSNEKRVPSGVPQASPLTGGGEGELKQWGEPPKKKRFQSGITAAIDGRTMIRSRPNFRPKVNLKAAIPVSTPAAYVHVPPPNPEDVQGRVGKYYNFKYLFSKIFISQKVPNFT